MENNTPPCITGVINAINSRPGKEGTKYADVEFKSIILETKDDKNNSTFPEFEVSFHASSELSNFSVNDHVEITYCLTGKRISPTWHKTVIRALYIRHVDIEGNDTRDLRPSRPKPVDTSFTPASSDDNDDLPF